MMIMALACQTGEKVATNADGGVDIKYYHMSSDDQGGSMSNMVEGSDGSMWGGVDTKYDHMSSDDQSGVMPDYVEGNSDGGMWGH
jgi:hypothetical protein